jgi:serralysin
VFSNPRDPRWFNEFYDPGNDYLEGGLGNDTLEGNEGNDILMGGAGRDHIKGGFGQDQLIGGEGDDRFHFLFRGFRSNYPPSDIDTIEDYNAAEGDQLIISAPNSITFDQFQYDSETGLLSYNGTSFAQLPTGLDFVPKQEIVLDIYSPVYDSWFYF